MIQREIIIRAPPPLCLQTMVTKEDKEIGREAIIQITIISTYNRSTYIERADTR